MLIFPPGGICPGEAIWSTWLWGARRTKDVEQRKAGRHQGSSVTWLRKAFLIPFSLNFVDYQVEKESGRVVEIHKQVNLQVFSHEGVANATGRLSNGETHGLISKV